MITEDYVSFETAKLLKKKGFNEPCYTYYDYIDDSINRFDEGYQFNNTSYPWGVPYNISKAKKYVVAPTFQMAMKWLREIYNIHIVLSPNKKMNNKYSSIIFVDKEGELYPQPTDFFHGSYKETAETAIKYCLEKLI